MSASAALWTWNTTGPAPTISGYGSTPTQTKTGLSALDLRNFVGIAIQRYDTTPPLGIDNAELVRWIRAAEDTIEQESGVLLTPTYVASSPIQNGNLSRQANLKTTSNDGVQRQGIDFDLFDAGYDFFMDRVRDMGWMALQTRYRPLRNFAIGVDTSAVKNLSFVYPLLNQFFSVPSSWIVEDDDFGLLRLVPSGNIQMLPLYALQISIGSITDVLPGGLNLQYTAGLSAIDYSSRFAFVKQLVLAKAAIAALRVIQTGVNRGVESISILVDGVQTQQKWNPKGAFAAAIGQYADMVAEHMETLRNVAGPALTVL